MIQNPDKGTQSKCAQHQRGVALRGRDPPRKKNSTARRIEGQRNLLAAATQMRSEATDSHRWERGMNWTRTRVGEAERSTGSPARGSWGRS